MIDSNVVKVTVRYTDYGVGDPGYHMKYIVEGDVVARGPHSSGRWAYSAGWAAEDRDEMETWVRGKNVLASPDSSGHRATEQVWTRPE